MFDALSSVADIGTGVGAMPGAAWLPPLPPMAVVTVVLAGVFPARVAARIRVAEALPHE